MDERWATTGIFLVHGAVVGTWIAHIPWVQERFGLSEAAMGLVLMSMSAAVVVALPYAGRAIARQGSARVTLAGGVASALAVSLPLLAPHPLLVVAALATLGGCTAALDVAMNAHGVDVERRRERPVMSSLHAGWSAGGFLGAGFAAALVGLGLDPRGAAVVAAALLLAAIVHLAGRIGSGSDAHGPAAPRLGRPPRGVLLLALICFLLMFTEGALADWSGIYLRQELGAPIPVAALAFAFLTAGMTLGRVFGDRLNQRFGAVGLVRAGALATALPLAAMLLAGAAWAALVGLFVIGIGVANGVPLVYSAAGRQPGVLSGPSIAAVSALGSLGFLAGPPLIGFLAEGISLPWALGTLVGGAVAVLALARRALVAR